MRMPSSSIGKNNRLNYRIDNNQKVELADDSINSRHSSSAMLSGRNQEAINVEELNNRISQEQEKSSAVNHGSLREGISTM